MIEPGSFVQVLFPGMDQSFPGTIRDAYTNEDNDGIFYDVEYAEPVNGKFVLDRRVPANRVTLMDGMERESVALQENISTQELPKGFSESSRYSSSSLPTKKRQLGHTKPDPSDHDDAGSMSLSLAPSDVTAQTTRSSSSSRPKRASAAVVKENMLIGDEMDEILEEVEQAERVEAVIKQGASGSSGSKTLISAKASSSNAKEGVNVSPNQQMIEEDVDVDILDSSEPTPLSSLTARDFISRLLKKIEDASTAEVKAQSCHMDIDGYVKDVFECGHDDDQGNEPECVLTPSEIIQLNEALTANQVHRMLRAIHCEGRGAGIENSSSSDGCGSVHKKMKDGKIEGFAEHNAVDEGETSVQSEQVEHDYKGSIDNASVQAGQSTGQHIGDVIVEHIKEEAKEEDEAWGLSASTKTGESLCRMLASQLCAFITNDSTVKADLQKAYLEALPEPDESMMEECDEDFVGSWSDIKVDTGKKSMARGKASGRKLALSECEVVASTEKHHPVQWLRAQNKGGEMLRRTRALLSAAASLLRILAISSMMSGVEVTVGSDKTVERALCAAADFLSVNFGSLSWRHKLGLTNRPYSRMEEQLVMVVIRTSGFACLPLIRSAMGAVQCLLASRAQSTAIVNASMRLAFAAMEADPHCSANAACLEFSPAARSGGTKAGTRVASLLQSQVKSAANVSGGGNGSDTGGSGSTKQRGKDDATLVARGSQMSPLLSLHSSARSLLQCLGQHYPQTRSRIIEDMIQLLARVYVGDEETSHRKLRGQHQVYHSAPPAASAAAHALGFTGNPRFVTDSLVLLLCFIQSSGMSNTHSTAPTSRLTTPNEAHLEEEKAGTGNISEDHGEAKGKGKGKSKSKGKGKSKGKSKGKGKGKGGKNADEVDQREEEDDSYFTSFRKVVTRSAGLKWWGADEMRSLDSNPFTSSPVHLCHLFVKELLDRCETPELCTEYREVCLCLLQELAIVLPSPRFPCAGILLDTLRIRVSGVLTNEHSGVTEARPATDPQSQLIVFYMEVLSRMATMLRCVQKVNNDQNNLVVKFGLQSSNFSKERGTVDDVCVEASTSTDEPNKTLLKLSDYNSDVLRAVKDKLRSGQSTWLSALRGKDGSSSMIAGDSISEVPLMTTSKIELPLETATTRVQIDASDGREPTKANAPRRSTRIKASSTIEPERAMDADTNTAAGTEVGSSRAVSAEDIRVEATALGQKLKVLENLCTIAVDAVSEYLTPAQCSNPEYVDRHFALCAHPFALLSLVGADMPDDESYPFYLAVQGVCTRDLHQYLVCDYIQKRLLSISSTRNTQDASQLHIHGAVPKPDALSVSSGDSETESVLSAYHMLLALWQRDALIEEHHTDATAAGTSCRASAIALCVDERLQDIRFQSNIVGGGSNPPSHSSDSVARGIDSVKVHVDSAKLALHRPSRHLHTLHSWIQARYCGLATQRFVSKQSDYMVEMLLNLMGQPASVVRSKSIKIFGRLFTADPAILQARHDIRSSVAERLRDVEIKVREEATKVLGQSLKHAFAEIKNEGGHSSDSVLKDTLHDDEEVCVDEYIDPLLLCLRDKGVSVRKAAVHVLRDILLHAPLHPRYAGVCLELALRAKEEEGTALRDVIRACFQQLWFTRSNKKLTMTYSPLSDTTKKIDSSAQPGDSGDANPKSAQPHSQTIEATFTHAEDVAAHLVNVIALMDVMEVPDGSGPTNAVLDSSHGVSTRRAMQASLTELVRELTHGQFSAISDSGEVSGTPAEAEGGIRVSKATLLAAKRQFEDVSSALVDFLVRIEEQEEALLIRLRAKHAGRILGRGRQSATQVQPQDGLSVLQVSDAMDTGEFSEAELLMATMGALQLLCLAMPTLLTDKISILLPYLQAHPRLNPSQQARVALMVTDMTTSVISSLAHANMRGKSTNTSISAAYQAATGNGMSATASGPSMIENALVYSLPGISFPSLLSDLQNIIFRAPVMNNVNSAIRCMATVTCHITDDATQYMMIGTKCFNAIANVARVARSEQNVTRGSLISVSKQALAQVQRALVVLGALCEHSKLCFSQLLKLALTPGAYSSDTMASAASAASDGEDERLAAIIRDMEDNKARLSLQEDSRAMTPLTINGSCYASAVFALSIDDVSVQTRAVQALCQSFIGCPRLAFTARDKGIFSSLMDTSKYPELFIEKFLVGMNSVMVLDETRTNLAASQKQPQQPPGTENATKGRRMKSLSYSSSSSAASVNSSKGAMSGLDVMALMMAEDEGDDDDDDEEGWSEVGQSVLTVSANDADTTAAGAVCVQHKDSLLALLTHPDVWLRLASLRLIATLLRQGILCPLDAVANLVCMQSDANPTLRQEALEILTVGDRKHPTFLDNRVVKGLEMAFDAQVEQVRNARLSMADTDSPGEQWEALHSPISATDISPTYTTNSTLAAPSDSASMVAEMEQPVTVHSLFGDLYKECFQAGGKKRCDAFLVSILRAIQRLMAEMKSIRVTLVADFRLVNTSAPSCCSSEKVLAARARLQPQCIDMTLSKLSHAAGVCQYLMSILAHLPYETLGEPLQIIAWVRRHVTVDTALLADELTSAVSELSDAPVAITPSSGADMRTLEEGKDIIGLDAITPCKSSAIPVTPSSYLKFNMDADVFSKDATSGAKAASIKTSTSKAKATKRASWPAASRAKRGKNKRGGVLQQSKRRRISRSTPADSEPTDGFTNTMTEEEKEEDGSCVDSDDWEHDSASSLVSSVSSHSHSASARGKSAPTGYIPYASDINMDVNKRAPIAAVTLDEGLFLRWVDGYCRSCGGTQGLVAGLAERSARMSDALRKEGAEMALKRGIVDEDDDDDDDDDGIASGHNGHAYFYENEQTTGLAVAALVLMGGEEARIREALMLLRQWLMRMYRLTEDKCAQYESSTNATGRQRAVKDAINAVNKEVGSLQRIFAPASGMDEDVETPCFEAFLSGASSVPPFGYGSNIHIAISPPGSDDNVNKDANTDADAAFDSRARVTPPQEKVNVPHHSCIFSSLASSPQSALEAVKSSLSHISKMTALVSTQELPVAQKRKRMQR